MNGSHHRVRRAACTLLVACAPWLALPAIAAEREAAPAAWHLQRIRLPQAWALTQGSARAPIAIVDSGIDPFHPDLKGKLLPGINTADKSGSADQFGHGTKMAGIAGAAGAAPLMPVRVTDRHGRASGANIAKGIVWAVDHGARVINLSLDGVVRSAAVRDAAEYAHRHGALVVAPSGNCSCRMEMPDTPFILSVAATDEHDRVLPVSTTGPFVDLAAPGAQVPTTAMFGVHLDDSGTSVASAIVSGVAALMFAANPSLGPDEVRTLLLRTAVDPDGALRDRQAGVGRVDALAAVQAAAAFRRESATAADDPVALGRRIYREGVLASGAPLVGAGAAGVRLSGPQAACVTCHRRSGYGSSEGSVTVRAITGPALFGDRVAPLAPGADSIIKAPPRHALAPAEGAAGAAMAQAQALRAARTAAFAGARPRPAYDEALLARAIRQGIDVTNLEMNPAMPRYELAEPDLRALSAYLKTLSAQIAPGVTEEQVHFATVIQPGVDAATRAAMLEVLQAFVRDRNLGRRAEQRREQAGMVRVNRVYREWVLHVWDLAGEPASWPQQLAARYREQPVFALVGGLGAQDWSPIHDFCESVELPEVFPQTSLPGTSGSAFYSIYLNRGALLEARALARFLAEGERDAALVQVFRDEGAGRVAAAAFREAWAAAGGAGALSERVLRGPADGAFWSRLAADNPGARLVLWLGGDDLAGLAAMAGAEPGPQALYLSHGLGGERAAVAWPDAARLRLRVVYPLDLPAVRGTRLEVVRQWMKNNGIPVTHEEVQMNAYLAATVTGMAVTHSADTYSREYFVERVEHRMGTALELSVFPRLSLGPGQRFASKGSYVAEFAGAGGAPPRIVSDWIVP